MVDTVRPAMALSRPHGNLRKHHARRQTATCAHTLDQLGAHPKTSGCTCDCAGGGNAISNALLRRLRLCQRCIGRVNGAVAFAVAVRHKNNNGSQAWPAC